MRVVESPNHDERPAAVEVSLALLHCISLPPGHYGGDGVERLFTNCLDPAAHPYYREISALRVSSHFFIRRDGELLQFVPVAARAWHAGASSWRGRSRCNDYSVGIELEGAEGDVFEDAQYSTLARLLRELRLTQVAAHSDVAPGRKSDPGAGFDWQRLLAALAATK